MSIEIWCSCGQGLCGNANTENKGIVMEPCPECIKEAHDEGYNEGYEAGELTCEECE